MIKASLASAGLAIAVITGASLAALPASANTYDYTYQTFSPDPTYSMSLIITTSNTENGGNPDGYNITGVTGTLTDPNSVVSNLSLFAGNATPPATINNPSWVVYDNSLIPTTGVTSSGGWMFQSSNGFLYNLWLGNGSFNSIPGLVYLYSNDGPSAPFSDIPNGPGEPGVLRLTSEAIATPLPAALPLFAGGMGLIGLLGARKRRKAQVA